MLGGLFQTAKSHSDAPHRFATVLCSIPYSVWVRPGGPYDNGMSAGAQSLCPWLGWQIGMAVQSIRIKIIVGDSVTESLILDPRNLYPLEKAEAVPWRSDGRALAYSGPPL